MIIGEIKDLVKVIQFDFFDISFNKNIYFWCYLC